MDDESCFPTDSKQIDLSFSNESTSMTSYRLKWTSFETIAMVLF